MRRQHQGGSGLGRGSAIAGYGRLRTRWCVRRLSAGAVLGRRRRGCRDGLGQCAGQLAKGLATGANAILEGAVGLLDDGLVRSGRIGRMTELVQPGALLRQDQQKRQQQEQAELREYSQRQASAPSASLGSLADNLRKALGGR